MYEEPEDELNTLFMGIYYIDNPEEFTEMWQIVFEDCNGKNPRLTPVHAYIKYNKYTEEKIGQVIDGVRFEGAARQVGPDQIGHKRVSNQTKLETLNLLQTHFKVENQKIRLKNQYEEDQDFFSYQEQLEELDSLTEEGREIYEAMLVKEALEEILYELSLEEATNMFHEYLFMNAQEEITMRQENIEQCKISNRRVRGIQYPNL